MEEGEEEDEEGEEDEEVGEEEGTILFYIQKIIYCAFIIVFTLHLLLYLIIVYLIIVFNLD